MAAWTQLLLSEQGALSCGATRNLRKRLRDHNGHGSTKRYTFGRRWHLLAEGRNVGQTGLLAALAGCHPACIGGHGTEPYEQNTQQSPGFGLSFSPHPLQT